MANTPKTATYDVKDLTLTSGNNTIRATAEAPTLKLAQSDKTELDKSVNQGDLIFDLKADGTYAVIDIGNMRGSIEIPPTYRDVDVTEIAANAFINKTQLNGVTIPNTVKLIGENAFAGSGINSIEFVDKDEIIVYLKNTPGWLTPYARYNRELTGEDVYHDVEMVCLEEDLYCINIPLDTISISFTPGDASETTKFYSIKMDLAHNPNILYTPSLQGSPPYNCIVDYFYDVGSLSLYKKIPGGLVIDNNAFKNCTFLTEVSMPRRLTSIRGSVFSGCENLVSCTYADYSWLAGIGGGSFRNCTNLTHAVLPKGVAAVGVEAYMGCTSMAYISLNAALKEIKKSAFENCTALVSVLQPQEFIRSRLTSIGAYAFRNCTSWADYDLNRTFTIPSSVTFIGIGAFEGCRDMYERSLKIHFEDPYTWFVTSNATFDALTATLKNPEFMDDSGNVYLVHWDVDKYWHKLKKMPPPEISIDGDILTMKDNLGVAEKFYIYVGKNATKPYVTIDKDAIS